MKTSVDIGMNKSGIQMAPKMAQEAIAGQREFNVRGSDSRLTPIDVKAAYSNNASPLGSVPLPGSFKGAVSMGIGKLSGKQPEVLIDKLGERMAFERTGVRLYDALIAKCEAAAPDAAFVRLREFRDEELRHFHLVRESIEKLGADPTAMTPSADASGTAAMGLVQIINEPRASIAQSVQAILIAELADNDGWDLLISLAKEAGLSEDAAKFEQAKRAEEKHVAHIRSWYERLVKEDELISLQ